MEMKIDTKDMMTIISLCETAIQAESIEVESGPIGYWQRVQERLVEWFDFYFKYEKIGRQEVEKLENITCSLFNADDKQKVSAIGTVYFSLKEYLKAH